MAEEEQRTKDRLRDKIENTVEDSLRVRRDDVAALTDTPGNGVQDPDDGCQATARYKYLANILADVVGVLASFPGELIDDINEGDAAYIMLVRVLTVRRRIELTESKVSPLVGALDQSANKTSNNHDLVNEDDVQNCRPRHASGEEKIHEKQRSSDEPVDISNVEDLAIIARNEVASTMELNHNRSPAQVGTHSEVCDGGDHGDRGGDIVENSMGSWLSQSESDEDDGGNRHDSADGEVPVGTPRGDVDLTALAVESVAIDVQRIVASKETFTHRDDQLGRRDVDCNVSRVTGNSSRALLS
jgi:hypothetical protein